MKPFVTPASPAPRPPVGVHVADVRLVIHVPPTPGGDFAALAGRLVAKCREAGDELRPECRVVVADQGPAQVHLTCGGIGGRSLIGLMQDVYSICEAFGAAADHAGGSDA